MKALLLLPLIIFAGCATTVPPTVQIPIAQPCKVETPTQPTYRFQPPYQDIFQSTTDLLGDRSTALGYEIELRAALKACQ